MLEMGILSRLEKHSALCFLKLTPLSNNNEVWRLEIGLGAFWNPGKVRTWRAGCRSNCIEILIPPTLSHGCKGILAEVSQTAGSTPKAALNSSGRESMLLLLDEQIAEEGVAGAGNYEANVAFIVSIILDGLHFLAVYKNRDLLANGFGGKFSF